MVLRVEVMHELNLYGLGPSHETILSEMNDKYYIKSPRGSEPKILDHTGNEIIFRSYLYGEGNLREEDYVKAANQIAKEISQRYICSLNVLFIADITGSLQRSPTIIYETQIR